MYTNDVTATTRNNLGSWRSPADIKKIGCCQYWTWHQLLYQYKGSFGRGNLVAFTTNILVKDGEINGSGFMMLMSLGQYRSTSGIQILLWKTILRNISSKLWYAPIEVSASAKMSSDRCLVAHFDNSIEPGEITTFVTEDNDETFVIISIAAHWLIRSHLNMLWP